MTLSNDQRADIEAAIDEAEFGNLRDCEWYRRITKAEGYDPDGICSFGCVDEPACETGGPLPDPAPFDVVTAARLALAEIDKLSAAIVAAVATADRTGLRGQIIEDLRAAVPEQEQPR